MAFCSLGRRAMGLGNVTRQSGFVVRNLVTNTKHAHTDRAFLQASKQGRATRWYSEGAAKKKPTNEIKMSARERQIAISEMPFSQLTPAQKVVEGTKTAGSITVIAVGLGLCGVLVYNLAGELFGGADKSEKIMQEATEVVANSAEIKERIGTPVVPDVGTLKHADYTVGDNDFTRMRFSVISDEGSGDVQLEKRHSGSSSKYRYLLVDCHSDDLRPDKRIVLIDNRAEDIVHA